MAHSRFAATRPRSAPPQSSETTVLVFEKKPCWTPELQRQFLDGSVTVRSCRSTRDLTALVNEFPESPVVIDLEAGTADCLQWLTSFVPHGDRPIVLVVGSHQTADLEWPLREAGATEFFPDHLTGDQLAHWCRRQWSVT